jgi:hypothetical protein
MRIDRNVHPWVDTGTHSYESRHSAPGLQVTPPNDLTPSGFSNSEQRMKGESLAEAIAS